MEKKVPVVKKARVGKKAPVALLGYSLETMEAAKEHKELRLKVKEWKRSLLE